jgi:hypothetical protein
LSGVKNGTAIEWGAAGSGVPSACPLSTSHRLTVPSGFPAASVWLSGLNASRTALPPANHGVAGFHVAVEETCTRPRRSPTATNRPSGLNLAVPAAASGRIVVTR